ncbi:hypothetical protein F9L07_18770 [Pimelobacter simplex]|uniref:Uncharacterized protein n=1 Tax=Nocardioides simplex TaxID=2045 RepID=A0A7J5DUV9_NOCSI|nr:hypothetical protein [Pimelobacter simplex]KAB2809102.1 hypothetical protein F9L07_18770 [Pimelobacter simplex]
MLTRALTLTAGPFLVAFAALVLVVAGLEARGRLRSAARRRTVVACAALLGLAPVVLSLLTA